MSSKRRQCRNQPDVFCYICGKYMPAKYRFNVRDFTNRAYKAYFGIHLLRSASNVQKRCAVRPKVKPLPCGSGFLWHGRNPKITTKIVIFAWYYPDRESAQRPVPHCTEVPVPVFTFLLDLTADETLLEAMEDSNSTCSNYSSTSMAAEAFSLSTNPKPFSQGQMNDLEGDLNLSKELFKLLASRLGEHGVLDSRTKITFYSNRDDILLHFFTMEDEFVVCNNIPGLLQKWVFQNTIQMNGDCSLTAPNAV